MSSSLVMNWTLLQQLPYFEENEYFFESARLQWKDVCGICTSSYVGFLVISQKVKKLAPEAEGTLCFIYRYALESKTLPSALQNVFD